MHQFLLNILVPVAGILLFNWTPGNILFCFGITMINYWLTNLALLLFFVKKEQVPQKISKALVFSFYFILSLVFFYLFIYVLSDRKNSSLHITMRPIQVLIITGLYWMQFYQFLAITKPSEKVDINRLTKEVSYRLTGIYLTLFCIIGYLFSFWSGTTIMNYALAFSLVFACSLTDLVLISVKMSSK